MKALVDEIVEELAKDPRVAAAYDLWYQLREEVLRTYREDLPERLPLSRQKEFKRIKNLVIEEAVRLGEHEMYPKGENAHPWNEHALSANSSQPVLTCTTRLLHCVGSLFQERTPLPAAGVRFTDSKLRRKIREKKIAMGHRPDDHTPTITS